MYTVYLVDDEYWITMGLKKLIEKMKFPFKVIGESNNGMTAWVEIEEKKPDVVFTDIRMPGIDGLKLLEKIREEKLDINVILVSGYAEFAYAQKALQLDAFDYILKPFDQNDLEEVFEKLTETLKAERGSRSLLEEEPEELDTFGNQPIVDSVIEKIQKQYMENISLTELAEEYNISPSYLSSLLKMRLGISFSDYVATKRLQKAKELLLNSRLSIDEIADKVGYHDYFYFTKVFKKHIGTSPSKYRKNNTNFS